MSEVRETLYFGKNDVQVLSVGNYPPSRIRESPPATLILVGPGNPGYIPFYEDFAILLHAKSTLPVWLHGFIGFGSQEPYNGIEPKYGLMSQVEMVKALIKTYLEGVRIICVDHSTSCSIILHILQDPEFGPRVDEAFFLMPVFTRPDNVQGNIMHYAFTSKIITMLAECFTKIYGLLPSNIQHACVKIGYRIAGYQNIPKIQDLVIKGAFERIFLLGDDLFSQKFDLNVLINHADRVHIITSKFDELLGSWFKELRTRFPAFDVIYHPTLQHSFYIDGNVATADIISKWINEVTKKKNIDMTKSILLLH